MLFNNVETIEVTILPELRCPINWSSSVLRCTDYWYDRSKFSNANELHGLVNTAWLWCGVFLQGLCYSTFMPPLSDTSVLVEWHHLRLEVDISNTMKTSVKSEMTFWIHFITNSGWISNICCRFFVTITVFRIHLQISTRYQMAQRTIDFFSYKNCEIFDNLNPASFTSACYRGRAFSWPRLEYDRVSRLLIAFNNKKSYHQRVVSIDFEIHYVSNTSHTELAFFSESANETQKIRILSLQGY